MAEDETAPKRFSWPQRTGLTARWVIVERRLWAWAVAVV
jgi:hypothetical protein